MRKAIILPAVLATVLGSGIGYQAYEYRKRVGEEIERVQRGTYVDMESLPLSAVLANRDAYVGQAVGLEGYIHEAEARGSGRGSSVAFSLYWPGLEQILTCEVPNALHFEAGPGSKRKDISHLALYLKFLAARSEKVKVFATIDEDWTCKVHYVRTGLGSFFYFGMPRISRG